MYGKRAQTVPVRHCFLSKFNIVTLYYPLGKNIAYITISLPHDFVLHHATEAVTEKYLTAYQDFVQHIEAVPPISSLEADG
jgi:hypothetical protein